MRIKIHRSYRVDELARTLKVCKGTIRNWVKAGLAQVDEQRPCLFSGEVVRAFLQQKRAQRKRPCGPDQLFCFKCKEPRRPAEGTIEFTSNPQGVWCVTALCPVCASLMKQLVGKAKLAHLLQIDGRQATQPEAQLTHTANRSVDCDFKPIAKIDEDQQRPTHREGA